MVPLTPADVGKRAVIRWRQDRKQMTTCWAFSNRPTPGPSRSAPHARTGAHLQFLHLGCIASTHQVPLHGIQRCYDLKAAAVSDEAIVMSTTHSPQSQHQARTGVQPAHALRAAIRGLRILHDEQMLMWQAFFRTQVRPGSQPARPRHAPRQGA